MVTWSALCYPSADLLLRRLVRGLDARLDVVLVMLLDILLNATLLKLMLLVTLLLLDVLELLALVLVRDVLLVGLLGLRLLLSGRVLGLLPLGRRTVLCFLALL